MREAIRRTAGDERGAASVLVIFMLLVLVTLGAIAITSANVNFKLNRRTIEWNAMYYELDGKGEEFLAELDEKLARAEANAVSYIDERAYLLEVKDGIQEEMQMEIFERYGLGELGGNDILNIVYMYYADIFVTELLLDFPDLQVYSQDNGIFKESLLLEMNVKSERSGYEMCSLVISVWAEPLDYNVNERGEEVLAVRASNAPRYVIEDWYEYQEPLQKEDAGETGGELWDGSL